MPCGVTEHATSIVSVVCMLPAGEEEGVAMDLLWPLLCINTWVSYRMSMATEDLTLLGAQGRA